MNETERMAMAGNVLVPAILALKDLGYTVSQQKQGYPRWVAQLDHRQLLADDPVQLLGLALLRERRGQRWSASDDEVNAVLHEYELDS